jgi:outer membrane PBP1 activator LpoA protein
MSDRPENPKHHDPDRGVRHNPPSDGVGNRQALVRRSDQVANRWVSPVEGDERDFLLLVIYIYLQHQMNDRAQVLVEAMAEAGDSSREVVLAQAILAFMRKDYERTLEVLARLDRIDPIERYARNTLSERQRMRSYLRARSLHELGDDAAATVDLYIRHQERPSGRGGEE